MELSQISHQIPNENAPTHFCEDCRRFCCMQNMQRKHNIIITIAIALVICKWSTKIHIIFQKLLPKVGIYKRKKKKKTSTHETTLTTSDQIYISGLFCGPCYRPRFKKKTLSNTPSTKKEKKTSYNLTFFFYKFPPLK